MEFYMMNKHDEIAERIVGRFFQDEFPLQKFMSFKKYSDLITKSSLYTCRSNRFNDTREAYLFIEENILYLKDIINKHSDQCTFISYESVANPMARIYILLKNIFDFKNSSYMLMDKENSKAVRPDYDIINGYHGFDYKSAKKILNNDVNLLRLNTYIACFSCNLSINKEMVKEYGEIIIRTSKKRLRQAILIDTSEFIYQDYVVSYFKKNKKELDSMLMFENMIYGYSLFGCKRTRYEKEEEFRSVITRKSLVEKTDNHILLKINLEKLIEEIIVTQYSDFKNVKNLNETYGYNFKINYQQII